MTLINLPLKLCKMLESETKITPYVSCSFDYINKITSQHVYYITLFKSKVFYV